MTSLSSSEDILSEKVSGDVAIQQTQPLHVIARESAQDLWKPLWSEALLPYLCTRVVLLLVGLLGIFYIMPLLAKNPFFAPPAPFPQELWLMWKHFDSGFYIQLAWHGYAPASALHTSSNWAFYPLYPLLIAGLGRLMGGGENAFALAGYCISFLASLVAVGYLYALVRRELGGQIAARAVFYLAIFPLSFYLSAVYPEALFLAFAIAACYYARQQSWWLAGLCGGLAALTRPQGSLLLLPLACEYLRVIAQPFLAVSEGERSWPTQLREYFKALGLAMGKLHNWFTGIALCLIPGGLLCFLLYAKLKTGDLLATVHTEAWGWGRTFSPPWRLLIYSLRHPIIGQPLNWNFWLLNMFLALASLGVIIWAWRKLPVLYALYATVMVLLPLSSNFLNSFDRYSLTVFPAFILLALFGERHKNGHILLVTSFTAIQAVCTLLYVMGVPVIA
jgi:hypothetical protein